MIRASRLTSALTSADHSIGVGSSPCVQSSQPGSETQHDSRSKLKFARLFLVLIAIVPVAGCTSQSGPGDDAGMPGASNRVTAEEIAAAFARDPQLIESVAALVARSPALTQPRPEASVEGARTTAMATCLSQVTGMSTNHGTWVYRDAVRRCGRIGLASEPAPDVEASTDAGVALSDPDGGGAATGAQTQAEGGPGWAAYVGRWRGGSVGCRESLVITSTPDERGRLVRGTTTGCFDVPMSYSGRQFEQVGTEWRSSLGSVTLHVDPSRAAERQVWLTGADRYSAVLHRVDDTPGAPVGAAVAASPRSGPTPTTRQPTQTSGCSARDEALASQNGMNCAQLQCFNGCFGSGSCAQEGFSEACRDRDSQCRRQCRSAR